ncbi:MAG: ATP-binding cassette domain-containing protein [Desulfomicrobium sp.]|uniref:ATP-binding cassette domain-containing protein n=1 Tax=Hoeflea sp. TaxID=1940281 RepID=UPI0025C6BA3F|nr:ATP-binding cassette domain-containing protein [Hoeflea sp.]MBU4527154.1 ATP-binding cassette domain-containing protein [Alphaproteobacteria bacterium]MBV1713924.1 ATP-binding cassette domain-containing protein [Desulfomicrobium sp.]MBU4544136.1 ATP-binding cassette domain-containing protein [Alphaproteobacteria bacterium]MBU4552336.1 ATP-binding cassette domain-containing protein [Alphaproteobacteria bacterium]MBV1786203.1 ATP-binding cassette domain-containing protein [Hoeflea sp.]
MTAPLMEIREVSRVFPLSNGLFRKPANLVALDNVSLDIHRGEVLALVGESGSGKSTLSRILLGLDVPTAGEVRLDGLAVPKIARREFARRVQPIFQDPYSSLNPRKTVRQLIEMPLVIAGGVSAAERLRRVRELLDILRMPSRMLDAYPSQMSGGQRQRVAIARALISRPEIVICDEPTSALDVSVQAQVLNLLMELRAEFDLTYLFISHDLAVVEYIADRVAVMQAGRIVELAPVDQLFAAPQSDYTRRLLDSVLTVPMAAPFLSEDPE